jgi:hypothetical protein
VRQIRKGVAVTEEPAAPAEDPEAPRPAPPAGGPAAAVGLFAAPRRAFVGGGAENNWSIGRAFFSSLVPIPDFIHALSYGYAAAPAGRGRAEGWRCYARRIGRVWPGRVSEVLGELGQRQAEVGAPPEQDPEASPRKVVAQARA